MRALAVRTITHMNVKGVLEAVIAPLKDLLRDRDPYVCKTAALAVGKIYFHNEEMCMSKGLLDGLKNLLQHDNSMVVANTVAVLNEIAIKSQKFEFALDEPTANKLLTACDEASEWSQAFILDSIISYTPTDPENAELFCERISPRLQHANSAIVLSCTRIILHFLNYMKSKLVIDKFLKKLGPPLVTLLHGPSEIQYIALKNIQLIIQKHKNFLQNDIKVFFCRYNDPIYVKLSKLEILYRLANSENIRLVLPELKEYIFVIKLQIRFGN